MAEEDLVKLIPNYKDVLTWQAEQNTSQGCHYYFAQSLMIQKMRLPHHHHSISTLKMH